MAPRFSPLSPANAVETAGGGLSSTWTWAAVIALTAPLFAVGSQTALAALPCSVMP